MKIHIATYLSNGGTEISTACGREVSDSPTFIIAGMATRKQILQMDVSDYMIAGVQVESPICQICVRVAAQTAYDEGRLP